MANKPIAKRFDLQERLIDFAVKIIQLTEALPDAKAGNHVRGQLIRCGTSPAPNYAEAQSAESRSDFIHKIRIVLKELRETKVWLLIVIRTPLLQASLVQPLVQECDELISIFVASINTAIKKAK